MLKKTACALALTGMIGLGAGCANDETGARSAGAGALGGGALGAGIGALVGGRQAALIGAGIGAIAGAGIGTYLNQQQRDLEQNLEGTGATVTNTGEALLVNMPAEVTFAVDRADIQPQFYNPLARVANTLNQYESSLIDVIGHTDSTGEAGYNQALSERRADSVAGFLINRGVLSDRIIAYGRGETEPIATNETASGRAMNRRVELIITPITEG
ncbi:OmpA family protein [Pikeienuella piscinae]|uniref:OmpA family protein n=1 Tax=Pikeienuella piscinae TaxID=2748098 RepID=A0A7L5BTX4_9RHOB|nr:OmpA family protein [Pikeienuella piscinae]QIE54591.1 OmpA family protein [Pikeienuella piscinae]